MVLKQQMRVQSYDFSFQIIINWEKLKTEFLFNCRLKAQNIITIFWLMHLIGS